MLFTVPEDSVSEAAAPEAAPPERLMTASAAAALINQLSQDLEKTKRERQKMRDEHSMAKLELRNRATHLQHLREEVEFYQLKLTLIEDACQTQQGRLIGFHRPGL